jgi:hypothetical protein
MASVDIPCGATGYSIHSYLDPGSMATFAHQLEDVFLPYGPATYNYSKVVSLQCNDPGPYTWSVRIECDSGGGPFSESHGTFSVDDKKPQLTNFDASIDSEACTYAASVSYHAPCGVKAGDWTLEIYMKKGAASGLQAGDKIAGPVAIPCGIGDAGTSANGSITGKGTHYFTFVLKRNGAVDSQTLKLVECFGCEPTEGVVFAGGNAFPLDSIAETIWLVKPIKSAAGFTYEDQRLLSQTYRMIDWWYYRNGGCGPFDLVLGENFPELEIALQGQYEIHVRIKLPTDSDFTTWYRGIIRAGERRTRGDDTVTELRGQGYNSLLSEIYVGRRYPKGLTASQIVNDLIDNYIKPNSKIARPVDVDNTLNGTAGSGVDSTSYVTRGPVHFECSVLKALKFLAEIEGGMEFGVAANRAFFFRKKGTNTTNALFVGKDLTDITDAGKEVHKINQIRVEGKGFGAREFNAVFGDPTDITKYGLFERQIEVPWIEQQDDAIRWANNIITAKRDTTPWKTITWDGVNARLEIKHPVTAIDQLRVYDNQTSATAYNDYDINKIHYYKGWLPGNKGEVREKRRPRDDKKGDNPELRAVITTGFHHHDLVEELEEKLFDQVGAIKGKLQQFRNPFIDVTLPGSNDVSLYAVQMQGIPNIPSSVDVTNGPVKMAFWDGTRWVDVIAMRTGEQLPAWGNFPGEEFIQWNNTSHTIGTKYYWTGGGWVQVSGSGTFVVPAAHAPSHQFGGSDVINVDQLSGLLADPQKIIVQKVGANIGTRKRVNLIPGANVTLTVVDNPGSDRVDVTVTAAASGGGGGDIKSDGTVPFAADESMGGSGITNARDGVAATDYVTKQQLDTAALAGFDAIHEPVFWMLMG